jgi:uncharacterized protein (DUF2336 family)
MRIELAEKIGESLLGTELAPGEINLAHDIVRILAWDVEEQVRASLSRSLRNARSLPRDVAMKLANDIDDVALPMLADSLTLSDQDLIDIVRRGSSRKQETIAGRPDLGEAVADALIIHASEPAVVLLMGNKTAHVNESSLHRAATRFADSDRVKRAMVLRDTLPITVAERLTALVSRELQEHLVKTHALSPEIAANIVLASREHAVIRLSLGSSDEDLQRMVTQMVHNGRLTPSLILRALCTGDIAFFEAAMAATGGVPLENAQILIHDRSRKGLAALYRKAALPEALFAAMCAAVDVVDENRFDGNPRDLERFRARVITRVLTLVEGMDASDADYLLDKLGDVLVHAPDPAIYVAAKAKELFPTTV